MKLFRYVLLSFFVSSILNIGCREVAADWFDDFESANIGDTIGSLGYTGSYFNTQVTAAGVGGSQGFEITPHLGDIFPRTFVPIQPGLQNVGDSLAFRIDLQMRNSSLSGGPTLTTMLDLSISDSAAPANQILGGVVREGANWNRYGAVAFSSPDFNLGDFDSVSELGLINNSTGEWSDWVTLELLVSQTAQSQFDITTNILDSTGTPLNTAQLFGVDLSAVFDSGNVLIGFGHFSDTWQISDRFRFDNISYSVNRAAVPEATTSTILLLGILGLSGGRRRSA